MVRDFFSSIFSFASLISLTVLAIAGSAAYFSIYGLVLIFSGAVVPVMLMAGSLEFGKLVLTSILFNYWRNMNFLLTTYCVAAVVVLMIITSVGIYGFLAAAYQSNQAPLAQIEKRIELLDAEFTRKNDRLNQMDQLVQSISSNYVSQRLKEKKQQAPERKELQARLKQIEQEKLVITSSQLDTEVHLGPIVKIAEAFGVTKDRAVHLLIMLFIVVFDPLAVALTLCVNIVIATRRQAKIDSKLAAVIPVVEQPVVEKTIVEPELEETQQQATYTTTIVEQPAVDPEQPKVNSPTMDISGDSMSSLDVEVNTIPAAKNKLVAEITNQRDQSEVNQIELIPSDPVVEKPVDPVDPIAQVSLEPSSVITQLGHDIKAIRDQLDQQDQIDNQNKLRNTLITNTQSG